MDISGIKGANERRMGCYGHENGAIAAEQEEEEDKKREGKEEDGRG